MTKVENIVIVGPMGSGKTTLGLLLSKKLNMKFVDTDQYLENLLGVSISWIFDQEGEQGFRNRESTTLRTILVNSQQIIATGGGVVTVKSNRELLVNDNQLVVYLRPTVEDLCSRLKYSRNRPILENADDRQETIRQLFDQRDHLYQQVADIIYKSDTANKNKHVDKLSEEIASWISA